MKTLKSLGLVLCLSLSSCASLPSSSTVSDMNYITQLLDKALPTDFNGLAHVEHKNPYFDFTIDAGGLHRTDKGWTWTWLRYRRSDRFTSGAVTLGSPPL